MLGLALDGRGIFGQFEAVNTYPSNLDACGGHIGTVPTTTSTVGTSGTPQTVTFNGGTYYHCESCTQRACVISGRLFVLSPVPHSLLMCHADHVIDQAASGFPTAPTFINCFGTDGTTTATTAAALYTTSVAAINCGTSGSYATYCTPYVGYAGCNGATGSPKSYSFCTSMGMATSYNLFCPIFAQASPTTKNSQLTYTPTSYCPKCSGACTANNNLTVTSVSFTGSFSAITTVSSPPPPPPPPASSAARVGASAIMVLAAMAV